MDIPPHFMATVRKHGSRMTAASSLVNAAKAELDAALQLEDKKTVEEARAKCVSAFEAFIDRKIEFFEAVRAMTP